MKRYKQINNSVSRIWLIAMILSMLFVQGQQTHIHTYSHDADSMGHTHYDTAHSIFNFTELPHADEIAQIDQAHSGPVSKISFSPMLAIILVSLLLVVCSRTAVRIARQYQFKPVSNQLYTQFRPPLRAPPIF